MKLKTEFEKKLEKMSDKELRVFIGLDNGKPVFIKKQLRRKIKRLLNAIKKEKEYIYKSSNVLYRNDVLKGMEICENLIKQHFKKILN